MIHDEKEYFQNLLNFSGGPGALPYSVLKEAQAAIIDAPGLGSSILGVSHRSEWFGQLLVDTEETLRTLMSIPENYSVLFLQGGSSLLFSMIPMNFAPHQLGEPEYVVSGYWSERAFLEASKVTKCKVLWSRQRATAARFVPELASLKPDYRSAYMHYVSNETVEGLQFSATPPEAGDCPIIADMSSDFLSRHVDVSKFGMIYAHAQKNLGPAGVTVAIIRDDLIVRCPDKLPDMLNFRTHALNRSTYNTPNVFGIYVLNRVLNWVNEAGTDWIFRWNRTKAEMVYETLDRHQIDVLAERNSRSAMNVSFTFGNERIDQQFLKEVELQGFTGLQGHRSIGGLRASLYNGVSMMAVEALCEAVDRFVQSKTKEQAS
jgi:phosphoserine aminotransferase